MREIVSKWTFSWVDNATKFIYAEYQSGNESNTFLIIISCSLCDYLCFM